MTIHWPNPTAAQRIEAIKSVWFLGASASYIGAAIGISRNAVIGMYSRHREALNGHPLGGGERPAQAKANSRRKPVTKQKHPKAALKAVAIEPEKPSQTEPRYVTLLENNGCKWAVNDRDKDGEHLFCGCDRMEGCSYCERHAALAFQHKDAGQDIERIAA